MKKILITGENSYIGGMFAEWVAQWSNKYSVDEISVHGEGWKEVDFGTYDIVYHVAGIAHVSSNPKLEEKYFQVNRDLTIEVAKKAKAEGVNHFIFMSSIIVYGTKNKFIVKNTKPEPDNYYGESKLQAEQGILQLQDDCFNIAIIRPPMIYGKDSKGNYPILSKIAKITPIFPDYDNQRSMLHIDNLTEFIRLVIDNKDFGIFYPQNEEYVKTSEMVNVISDVHGKKMFQLKLFNPFIKLLTNINLVNKVFGNLVYDRKLSAYSHNYRVRTFRETIEFTEKIYRSTE